MQQISRYILFIFLLFSLKLLEVIAIIQSPLRRRRLLMQDRYAGDVGDYGKFALLRAMEAQGLTVGVK